MKISKAERAEILTQALPYIQKYYDKIIVIKYGGNAMRSEELKASVMRDAVLLAQIGIKVVLVHGGGPEINETLEKMQITAVFSGGLRKTDAETMKVVQMVLSGKVNKDLVKLIGQAGGKGMGLSGIDGGMITAKRMKEELGYVGEITAVDTKPVTDLLKAGYLPVISSIGTDAEGNVYNINADTVAARIAYEIGAAAMISMTDIAGILRDKNDPKSLIPEIQVSDAPHYIKEGIIAGGMIPKIECCVEAIRRGVKRVFVLDGTEPHAILVEILSDEGVGTMFY